MVKKFLKFFLIDNAKIIRILANLCVISIIFCELISNTIKYQSNNSQLNLKFFDATSTIIGAGSSSLALYLANSNLQILIKFAGSMFISAIIIYTTKYFYHKNRLDNTDNRSFPSGHANIIIVSIIYFFILAKNKKVKISLFLFSILALYFRILSKRHFIEDILAGCLIAILITFLVNYIIDFIFKYIKNS